MGAHIVGAACDEYHKQSKERIPHATGLDVASKQLQSIHFFVTTLKLLC